MDEDVARTLGELESKLSELERTLSAIGREDQPGQDTVAASRQEPLASSPASEPGSSSRLIDESTEHRQPAYDATPPATAREQAYDATPPATAGEQAYDATRAATAGEQAYGIRAATASEQAYGIRAATAGESVYDATPPATAGQPPYGATPAATALDTGARASAARIDRAQGAGSLERPDQAQPPSTAELLRFRDRLERIARELTHDYDDLLGRLNPAGAASPGPTISFARGAPSLDIVDVEGLRRAADRALQSDPQGTTAYGTAIGYPRLRAWIADRHGVAPERVIVTNGSMQADAFLFEHLVRPGDEVIVERPTYDRTLLSLRQRGARLHALELLPDGIDTDALARLLGGGAGVRPKLAHIIPNFQNPAGYTLSLARRHALLALAAEHGFFVFEDDPYVALRFKGESLPTMLSMDPDRVVYASSFSKTVCPGIRVGYLVGPPDLIEGVTKLATNTYISPNMVAQSIVYEFCASGAIDRSIETVRAALAERAQALGNALRSELADAEFVPPDGGYFLWVTLPEGTDVHALHRAAADRGVSFVKGTDFVLEGATNTLRLAYSGVTPKQIDEGVARLAAAYRSL